MHNVDAQQIIDLYQSGRSVKYIHRTMGVSRYRITRLLREAGIPLRSREESLKLVWRFRPRTIKKQRRPAPPQENAPICGLCGGKFTDDDKPVKGTTVCSDCLGSVVRIAKRRHVPLGTAARQWREGAYRE